MREVTEWVGVHQPTDDMLLRRQRPRPGGFGFADEFTRSVLRFRNPARERQGRRRPCEIDGQHKLLALEHADGERELAVEEMNLREIAGLRAGVRLRSVGE